MSKHLLLALTLIASNFYCQLLPTQAEFEDFEKMLFEKMLIEEIRTKRIDPNKQNEHGETLLMELVTSGDAKLVREALNAGADTRIENKKNRNITALWLIALDETLTLEAFKEIVSALIEADKKMYPHHPTALVNHQIKSGETLLHALCTHAIERRLAKLAFEKIKFLIEEYNANDDLKSNSGYSPRELMAKLRQ